MFEERYIKIRWKIKPHSVNLFSNVHAKPVYPGWKKIGDGCKQRHCVEVPKKTNKNTPPLISLGHCIPPTLLPFVAFAGPLQVFLSKSKQPISLLALLSNCGTREFIQIVQQAKIDSRHGI